MRRLQAPIEPTRSRLRILGLINVTAGCWLIALPFALHLPLRYPHQLAFLATLTAGVLVLTLAVLHMLNWRGLRRASRGNVMLGLWLVASPAVIGYTKYLPNGHVVALATVATGVWVIAGAALSLAGSEDEDAADIADATPSGT